MNENLGQIDWQDLEAKFGSAWAENMPSILEILAKATGHPMQLSSEKLRKLGVSVASQFTQFMKPFVEIIQNEPDPEVQAVLAFSMVTDMIHVHFPEVPSNENVYQFFARQSSTWSAPLKGRVNGAPWYFRKRHQLYRDFLSEAVNRCGFKSVEALLTESFEGLAPQFQSLGTSHWLPEELWRSPRRLNTKEIQHQFAAWRTIAADWDKGLRVVYSLLSLYKGKPVSWADSQKVRLHDRVSHIVTEPRLASLACQGLKSVTIRNALDHGNAVYNPQTRMAEFVDEKKQETLADVEVRIQAVDMALSNWSMLKTMFLAVDTQFDGIRIKPKGAGSPTRS